MFFDQFFLMFVHFIGMRGKRDVNEIYGTDEVEEMKRAPAGFFGMRGKKQPNVSIFVY